MKVAFLSLPYTSIDPYVMKVRYEISIVLSAELYRLNYDVRSPITHGHPIATAMKNYHDTDFWYSICKQWLKECNTIIVAMLHGWWFSTGVKLEVEYAIEKGKELYFIDPKRIKERKDGFIRTTERELAIRSIRGGVNLVQGVLRDEDFTTYRGQGEHDKQELKIWEKEEPC